MVPIEPAASLRALHICTRFLRGGSERRLVDIVHALPELDHHVVVGDASDVDHARDLLAPATVWREPMLVRAPDPLRDTRALMRLARLVRTGGYELVYTHQSKAGAVGRAAVRLARGPAVVHSLAMANVGPGYGWLEDHAFRLIERSLAARTAAYAVVGTDLARRYHDIGVPDDKLHVVRSGVRLPTHPWTRSSARARLRDRFDLATDRPMILSLGSLDARKNVLSLPQLLAAVHGRARTRARLVVAGDGPLANPLADELAVRGLTDDAHLLGHVSPVDDLVAAADVMVLLSSAEGLPQVLVQAAAAGTPFVAYEVDGVAELLALGARGVAIPLGDLDRAADATASCLDAAADDHEPRCELTEWAPPAVTAGHRAVFQAATGQDPTELGGPDMRIARPPTARSSTGTE